MPLISTLAIYAKIIDKTKKSAFCVYFVIFVSIINVYPIIGLHEVSTRFIIILARIT